MRWNAIKPRLQLSPPSAKRLGAIAIVLVVALTWLSRRFWWAMNQPPETFGRVMKRMPGHSLSPVPFEPMASRTAGSLQVGDAAPDFSLLKLDKTTGYSFLC